MSCPDCFRGGVSTSHPTGEETTLHGFQTYVARPEQGFTPKGVIVFITDAFGWDWVNNRVLADHYAKRGGFLVYIPDFMDGKSLSPAVIPLMDKVMTPASSWFEAIVYKPLYVFQTLYYAIPWKWTSGFATCKPRVLSFIQGLRTSAPPFPTDNLKIGAAGFCWGGQHTIFLAADTPSTRVHRHESQKSTTLQPLIDCAFTAHPSFIKVPQDIEAITVPTSVAVGENDMAMKAPAIQQMKQILEAKKTGEHEVSIIPGAKHGFAIRTHPDDKHEMECALRAEDQAISWFTKWFA